MDLKLVKPLLLHLLWEQVLPPELNMKCYISVAVFSILVGWLVMDADVYENNPQLWLQIMIHNVMQIGASSDPEYKQAHAFSIYLVQPLLATSLALLSFNW